MHGDLTAFDARVAALNASVAFTGAAMAVGGGRASAAEVDRAIENTIGTAERFERWLTRPETGVSELDELPPLATGKRDG